MLFINSTDVFETKTEITKEKRNLNLIIKENLIKGQINLLEIVAKVVTMGRTDINHFFFSSQHIQIRMHGISIQNIQLSKKKL